MDILQWIDDTLKSPEFSVDLLEAARDEITRLRTAVSNLSNTTVQQTRELSLMASKLKDTTDQVGRLVILLELVGVKPWAIQAILDEDLPADAPT